MKKYPLFVHVVLAVTIAFGIFACAIAQKQRTGVSVRETAIQIYPGTQISGDDQKALDNVLRQYKECLYKISTYDRGKVVKTRGSLEGARIDKRLVIEANEAALKGVSYLALQIGSEGLPPPPPPPGFSPTPTPQPTQPADYKPIVQAFPCWSPAPSKGGKTLPMEVGEMVNRVTPILRKYGQ